MGKFKVGDVVVGNAKADERYNITRSGWRGQVTEIKKDGTFRATGLLGDGSYGLSPECFDLVDECQKIVVTVAGKTTTARLYRGKDLVKSAEAKCSAADEFSFETGAALALDRLLGREEKVAEKELFPLEKIEAGYLLKVRDDAGPEYYMTVIPRKWGGLVELGCCSSSPRHWWTLKSFGPTLRYADSEVIAVYGPTCCSNLLNNNPEDRELLWFRK